MNAHPEPESLSALLDGTLDAFARAEVDAHATSCASCGALLAALRSTVAELRALPAAEMPGSDAARLRAEVARARRMPRGLRAVIAMSGAAAVIAGIAFISSRPDDSQVAGGVPAPQTMEAGAGVGTLAITFSDSNFDEAGVRALLAPTPSAVEAAEPLSGPAGAGDTMQRSATGDQADLSATLARCEREALRGADVRAVEYTLARYYGRQAFFLKYEVPAEKPDHVELFVVATDDCSVLYFAQRRLS